MSFSADSETPADSALATATSGEIMRVALARVRQRLPDSWQMDVTEQVAVGTRRLDALVVLRAPDDSALRLAVEAKRLLDTRAVALAIEQVQRLEAASGQRATPLLVARYIAPPTQERIVASGAAYADATGNLFIHSERPALFLRDAGAPRDPWRGPGRPRGSLRGPIAAQIVRGLIDFVPPMRPSELARRTRTSVGAVYRLVDFAAEEGLLQRQPRGPIHHVRWRALLERWSRDYDFQRSNTVGTYLAPRGLEALLDQLRGQLDLHYAITGSLAAHLHAPYAPARAAALHAVDAPELAARLGLRRVETGANVLLAGGDNAVAFERTEEVDGLRYVAPSQAAVDLLTGPGRNPSEGVELLDWMEAHEPDWRR